MGERTKIEWSDATWNVLVGCSKVGGPGCENCYAINVVHRGMAPQHRGLTIVTDDGLDWTGEIRIVRSLLDRPARRRKPYGLPDELRTPGRPPSLVFVNSLSDVFYAPLPLDDLADVWQAMVNAPQHTFQVLTKRPQLIARKLGPDGIGFYTVEGPVPCPQPNIWLGTSIETNQYKFRADHLRASPAAVRFLSLEPLLGPLPDLDLTGIDWVIVGGESGRKARPMHPQWVRDIRDRCADSGVAFFFKQWGEWGPGDPAIHASGGLTTNPRYYPFTYVDLDGTRRSTNELSTFTLPPTWAPMTRVGKVAAGRELDGRIHDEWPTTKERAA